MLQLLKLQHLLCEAKSKVPEYCPFNYERKDVKDGVVLFDCFPIMSEEAITLIPTCKCTFVDILLNISLKKWNTFQFRDPLCLLVSVLCKEVQEEYSCTNYVTQPLSLVSNTVSPRIPFLIIVVFNSQINHPPKYTVLICHDPSYINLYLFLQKYFINYDIYIIFLPLTLLDKLLQGKGSLALSLGICVGSSVYICITLTVLVFSVI